jgi:hypothetical protein
MNPNSALFQAILAMDAYNRVGDDVSVRNLNVTGNSIGNVTLAGAKGVNSSGFFAQSYIVNGTGQKIISYRGTDTATDSETSKDVLSGWTVGGGLYSVAQAKLAAQFFQQVVGNGSPSLTLDDLYNANVLLTGHSLGGGLAGLVASIYHQSGIKIFDSMDFTRAAQNLLDAAKVVEHFDEFGSLGFYPTDVPANSLFFLGGSPVSLNSFGQINYSVQGQGLSSSSGLPLVSLGGVSGALNRPEYSLGFDLLLGPIQRHSSALAVLLTFANETGIPTDWQRASRYVLTKLFENPLAQALGVVSGGDTGAWDASDKLLSMIAYSAIDEGTLLYGDTGIRALFDDTGDFGRALGVSNVSKTLTASGDPIGKIVAQYAGQLALDAIRRDGHPEDLAGILTLDNDQLVVDLNKNRWTSDSANPDAKILGRDDLLKDIRTAGGLSEDDFKNALSKLWDDPDAKRIDRIVIQTKEEAFSGSVPSRPSGSDENGVTFFITSGQNDTITGTAADEAIYGGDGDDKIEGGDGKDLLIGGDGKDTLDGGEKDDLLIGGAKNDILKGGAGKDELWGGDDDDQLWGGADNDIIRGGAGSDTIYADAGNDSIFGDDQTDTYRFKGDDAVTGTANPWDASGVSLTLGNVAATTSTGQSVIDATLIGSVTGADVLESVETVELTDGNDTVLVQSGYDKITDKILLDGLGQVPGTKDVLDFSQLDAPLSLTDAKLDGTGITFKNFEKLILTNKADTLKITSLSNLGGLNEIDAGANPAGTYDTVDLSKSSGAITFSSNTLNGSGKKLQLNNFEKIIGSSARDTLNLTKSSITWADGAAGNDVLTGGTAASILIGGDGTDQLFAGNGGDTLEGGVSNGSGDSYAGGKGADTFIIGNGTHAKQGIDARFNISNAGANDRLVLRLSDTAGANAASAFTKGIVLSGGIQPLIWLNDGRVQTPHAPDPNHVIAVFSSVLVKPTGVTAESDNGRSSATVNGKVLEDARPELGEFVVYYDWNKSASTLDINITTAYGDFAVHVDNYSAGQLGLSFIDKNEPIDGFTVFGSNAEGLLQGSWNGYNDAMRSLVQGAQLVDVPSPGNAANGDANPITPTIPNNGYLADFNSSFDPEAGSRFGGSGPSNPNDPNNNGKRAPFLDSHKNPLKRDPLVLDLSGNGLHLTAESLSDTYVDFNGSGFANRTGWVDAEAGILINYTGSTAIGPNTILGATSGDGFGDLAALDSNSDGQVDASDSAAASLRIWVDQDGDGRIGADEVFTLADAGVSSIGLQATASGQLMNENTIAAIGSFVRSDATTGDMFEVSFATDPVLTQTIIPDGFEYSAGALKLPGLDGYGHVADLRYDMTLDSSLANEALQLVLNSGDMTGSQFDAAFEHLVQSWAGAASLDPSSRGPLIDARHMAVVEAFYGQTFAEVNGAGAVLDAIDAANIEQAYGSILDAMKIRFTAQIKDAAIANGETEAEAASNPLAAFATLGYTAASDVVSLNLAQLAASITNAIPSDPVKREAYVDLIARATRALRVDFYAEDSATLAAGFDAAVATAGLALGSRLQFAAEITASSIIDATGQVSTVTGTSSNEVILAGAGNQTLAGGGGADVYIYSAAADGNDTIQAGGSQSGLILTDLARNDVTFSKSGEDVLIAIASTGKTITIAGQLNGQGAGTLQTIKFSDGTTLSSWDIAGLVNPTNEFDGTSGADNVVSPGYSNETYDLKAGNDHLFDRNVNGNTFVYRSGDGNDTYDVSSQQTPTSILKLLGLNAADITATRLYGDLLVKVNATNEIVTITGQFTDTHNGIATIQFANGTSWDRAAINAVPNTTPASVYSISGHPSVNDGGTLEFTVTRSTDDTSGPVTLSYSLGGTAVAGTDYAAPAGSVTFAPGELSKVIDIQTIAQGNTGPDKTVLITLASLNGSPGTISSAAGSSDGTIIEAAASLAITSQLLAHDTGRSQSDLITQDGHVALKGTTPAGATVLIFDGALSLGSAAISGTEWTFSANLSEGTHQLHAVAIDGNDVIATTSAAAKIVVDRTAPNPKVIDTSFVPVVPNEVAHFIISGVSEAGSLVQFTYSGFGPLGAISGNIDVSTQPSGAWSYDFHSFRGFPIGSWVSGYFIGTDAAGNVTPSIYGRAGQASVPGYSLVGTNTGPNNFTVVAGGSITFGNSSGGGNGKNTVMFVPVAGYYTDIIVNGGFGNILLTPDMASTDVYFQANSSGDLFIKFRDSDSYIDAHNALHTASWGVTSAITSIGNDSWQIPLGQAAAGLGQPLTFTWLGTGNNYYLTGSNYGSNVFEITAGSGIVNFGNSSQGGDGKNTVKYARGDATADIVLNGGTGVIALAAGIAAQDVYWQSNNFGDLTVKIRGDATDQIVVHGGLVNQAGTVTSAVGQLQFSDGSSVNLAQPLTFTWLGTGNNYYLTGSNYGSNVFEITAGSGIVNFGNSSQGGDGTNTVKYARGDATADIVLNGGTGVIALAAGIAAQDVYLQSNNFGDLTVKIRSDATDQIVVHGGLVNQAGTVTSAVGQLQFSDGSSVNLAQPLTFTWLGTGNNYYLTGSNYGSNVFEITAGSGIVNFGNSSQGGDGTNTVKYARGDATADIVLNGGTGVIAFAAGIAIQDVYLQANTNGDLIVKIRNDATDTVFLHNDLTNNAGTVTSAVGQLQFSDGSSVNLGQPLTFTWLGNGNNYYLTGSNFGANTFEITAGNGNVFFGSGSNTIKYHTGTGYVDVALNGGTGTIQMGPGVAASNVVYQSNANGDLIINIVGDPSDYIIVRNDYSTASGTLTSGISQIQFSDGTTMSPLSLDFIAPTVSSVVASGSGITSGDGTVGAGGVVTLTVNFSENVVVNTTGGTPTLALNDGGTATYAGGSGTAALTFNYTAAAGQNTSDLTVSGLNLNGGTIADAAGNAAVVSGASTNPAGTLLIDTSAPTVSSVAASPASGTVFLGSVVTLTVNFSENVVVTTTGGTPTLTLNDGGTATYASGSGTGALAFSHTVAAGQSTSDLAVTALNLNGGAIKDAAGNAAVVTGAATDPSGVLVVDGIAPTVNSVATSGAGITAGAGILNAGKVVTLTVNFSENVAVTTTGGTPTLALNDGGTAAYAGGSGSSALTFSYTVGAGQNTSDLTVTTLNLNGGTIKDAAGNAAVVTGAATNPAGTLQIDTTASTVSSVATSGAGITSGNGTVGVGTVVTLTVNFDENVVVTTTGGTPTLTLNDGGTATYAGGSGTGALAFTYTVGAGQNTSDLTVTALNLNGGTIKDVAGNTAVITGAATNPAGTLQIDTAAPTVSSVATSPASGTVILGGVVTLTVNFSENVVVTGTPTLTLNDGGTATYSGGSGSGALAFSYTVAAGQNTSDLTVTALNLNGGTIKDVAGNAAVVTGAATNPAGVLLIDGTAPAVSSVTTSPASGTVIAGGVVTLTVNFSESVAVNTTGGTPTLTLSDGGTATYSGGSGTGALTFSHTVAAGQGTADLTVTALNLNGGTIADVAGNTAVVTGAVTNPAGVLVIDGVAPTVSSVAASGSGITSGSGILNAGKVVTLTVSFSENVVVVTTGGTPTLTLNDGGTATYASGSGTGALAFNYTVAAGQNTPDLTVTALNLNGGTIKDAAGNAAVVTGAATNPAGTLQIDTAASTVSSVATSGAGITSGAGTIGVGTVVTLTVTFNENVVVVTTGGTPTLTLNDGGVATYTGGTGTSALTFNYTVAAGQSTADLTVTALNLNGGTIKDVAGNTAVVTGAATNPAGTLIVDGTAPTVSSVTTSPASGSVIPGSVVTLTVNFSEGVVVNTSGGTPTLTLNDGGTATYTGGSGTGALAFSYTVAAGQNTADLTVTALNLNGGTIKDGAGNTAVVTGAVTNPAGILLVDGTVPTASSIAATGTGITSGNGNLNAGKVVTLTASFGENVLVTTTGGTPTLALSDGGTANYTGGSGTSTLTFSHTVAAGQNTADLTVTGLNLNGGTVKDAAGNTAVIAGNPAGTLKIDTTAATVNSVATSGTGITAGTGALNAGKVVTLTATFSENVVVTTTGGTPSLTLNDGGTAAYTGGTGTSALTFNYTVAAGQNTADLTVTALNLNGGTIKDAAGNTAVVTGAATNPAGTLQIDTAASTVSSVATSGTGITSGSGVLNAGKVVTLTVNFNEAVVVTTTGGTPSLTLNDAGVATYTGGSGTSALTFNYTVAAGQNTADLTVTALNLNGGTIKDVAGNTAVVTGAVANPAGTLQIDTTAATVSSVVTSGPGITAGSGNLGVGAVVTLTVNFNEATVVTTTGGTPTLTLNDGGVATYTGGSGTTAQAFSYTVAAGQNTADLTVTALNLNGGTIKDVAGNTAVVTGAVTNPAGTLKITTSAGFMATPPGAQSFASAASSGPNIYTLSATGSATITPDYSSGASNEFDFTGNVTDQDLWFLRSGNNLQIDVIGTRNQTTINGWFNSGNQANEEFTAGGLKLDNQISQLVQAMAAYSGSHAGFDPTASTVHQAPNDAALQNTIAAAWHA